MMKKLLIFTIGLLMVPGISWGVTENVLFKMLLFDNADTIVFLRMEEGAEIDSATWTGAAANAGLDTNVNITLGVRTKFIARIVYEGDLTVSGTYSEVYDAFDGDTSHILTALANNPHLASGYQVAWMGAVDAGTIGPSNFGVKTLTNGAGIDLTVSDNYFNDHSLQFITGGLAGTPHPILGFITSTDSMIVETFFGTPSENDTFIIIPQKFVDVFSVFNTVLDGTVGTNFLANYDGSGFNNSNSTIGTATNLLQISGSSAAADNLEEVYDNDAVTGDFEATVALVSTVTDVTNQVTADVTAISGDALAADSLEFGLDGVVETNRERLFTNLDEVLSTRSKIGDSAIGGDERDAIIAILRDSLNAAHDSLGVLAMDNIKEAFDDDATGPTMRLRAFNVVAAGTDSSAMNLDGDGAGSGFDADGGTTGDGFSATSGASGGVGIDARGVAGGLQGAGTATGAPGFNAIATVGNGSGAIFAGIGTGDGIRATMGGGGGGAKDFDATLDLDDVTGDLEGLNFSDPYWDSLANRSDSGAAGGGGSGLDTLSDDYLARLITVVDSQLSDVHGATGWTTGGSGSGDTTIQICARDTTGTDSLVSGVKLTVRTLAGVLEATATTESGGCKSFTLAIDTFLVWARGSGHLWSDYDTIVVTSSTDTFYIDGYDIPAVASVQANVSNVYGIIKDGANNPVQYAMVSATMANKKVFNTCDSTLTLINRQVDPETDAAGRFDLSLIYSSCLSGEKWTFTITHPDGYSYTTSDSIPDSASYRVIWSN